MTFIDTLEGLLKVFYYKPGGRDPVNSQCLMMQTRRGKMRCQPW